MAILAGLVMLGVLVVVHEFGHFVVAKLFKIGVPVFSVGMGPRIGGFHYKGTDYRLSMLPVGGYVRMAGADPFGEEDPDVYVDPEEDFMRKPVWQRLLVMLAGPAFNLMLPFVLFTGVLMLGEPQPDPSVGTVLPGSMAAELGIAEGDKVRSVDGQPAEVWMDVAEPFLDKREGTVDLELDRAGRVFHVSFPVEDIPLTNKGVPDLEVVGMASYRMSARIGVDDTTSPAWKAGLRTGDLVMTVDGAPIADWYALRGAIDAGDSHEIGYVRVSESEEVVTATLKADPTWTARADETYPDRHGVLPIMLFVGSVASGSPAETAGVMPQDRLVSVDGSPVRSWVELMRLVRATVDTSGADAAPRELDLVVRRAGEPVTLRFAPRVEREIVAAEVRYRPIMGIQQNRGSFVPGPTVKKYYSIVEAVPRAVEETWFLCTATVGMLANLFTGDVKPQESLGGPIEIFRMAGEGAERGIFSFARLVGTISISLGIFNLLPVPVLDGGQILFYSIEGIRGRPLSLAIREKLQMAGVLALVALMLFVAVFDMNRWWVSGG